MIEAVSTSARRYLAVWLPFLPADRLRRLLPKGPCAKPDEHPIVFVEKSGGALRLAAVDRRALALGLRTGQPLADARARLPHLVAVDDDPAADRAFLETLAEACDRYTPLVALDGPDGLVLDITGCAHLFGGEQALRADLGRRLSAAGLTARTAVAGTPDAARALARFGGTEVAAPGDEAAQVAPLPVAALGLEAEATLALSRAGLKTVGALAGRPRRPLAARFGATLVEKLDRVLGIADVRIVPRRPPPTCLVERRFAEPIARSEDILGTLALLAAKAAGLLEARGEGGRTFEASFFRADGAVRRIAVETGRPSRDARAVLRLYRERLEALDDPLDPGFGFDLIRLAVPRTEPLAPAPVRLDRSPAFRAASAMPEQGPKNPHTDPFADEDGAIAALVDRLVARFGRGRVLRFAARDTHDPDRAATLVPAIGAAAGPPFPQQQPQEPPLRPLHLFDPPQPIETLAEVPDGPPLTFRWRRVLHQVARAEGPERIAAEWWRNAEGRTRDYYRLEDADGRRFWVFRDGLYGAEAEHPRWYLHGLFA